MTRPLHHLGAPRRGICRLPAVAILLQDTRGVSALEFAIIAPLMIAVLTGLYATEQLVRMKSQLNSTAFNMAKMVSTQQTMTAGILRDFCSGAKLTMTPYDQTVLSMSVASYTRKNGNSVTMDWENLNACPATGTPGGSAAAAMASQLLVPNGTPNGAINSTIVVTANYKYKAFGQKFYTYNPIPSMTLSSQVSPGQPRYNATITCTNC